ncbi:MAG TPA: hypothetical protein VLG92_00650 [Candidatus Saccharimonadia bacterium]|nr:hypothetical protein [Candidatus Saccharimonadia bacterium]
MKALFYNLVFASVYGSGAYSSSTYNGTNGGAAAGSGSLSNTGIAVAIIVTIAAVLLLIAMAVRIWKRPSKKSESSEN